MSFRASVRLLWPHIYPISGWIRLLVLISDCYGMIFSFVFDLSFSNVLGPRLRAGNRASIISRFFKPNLIAISAPDFVCGSLIVYYTGNLIVGRKVQVVSCECSQILVDCRDYHCTANARAARTGWRYTQVITLYSRCVLCWQPATNWKAPRYGQLCSRKRQASTQTQYPTSPTFLKSY